MFFILVTPAAAKNRITTGVVLAVGHSFGEAAALIYTSGLTSDISLSSLNPFQPYRAAEHLQDSGHTRCPHMVSEKLADPAGQMLADMAAALLIILVLTFNLTARYLWHRSALK